MKISTAIKTLKKRYGTGNYGYEMLARELSAIVDGYISRAEIWNVERGRQRPSDELILALESHPDISYRHPRRYRIRVDFRDPVEKEACYRYFKEVHHCTPQEYLRDCAEVQLDLEIPF